MTASRPRGEGGAVVQSVDRAVQVLIMCAEAPATVGDIAERLGVHRTSALRILQSLEASRFVKRDRDGRFRIGYGLYTIATRGAAHDADLRETVRPYLVSLADETGFAVHCAIVADDRIVSLDIVEPPYSIRLPLRIGGDVVIHTAGVAKAILAYLEPRAADRVLDNATWERYTERTITSRAEMYATLSSVRSRGWAYDDGEFEDISNCIAAPFFRYDGLVVGAFSLTTTKSQVPLSELQDHVPLLRDRMRELSSELGYSDPSRIT